MCKRLTKTRHFLGKYCQKLAKMNKKFVISVQFVPPRVKIEQFEEGQSPFSYSFVMFDPKSLQIQTHSEPLRVYRGPEGAGTEYHIYNHYNLGIKNPRVVKNISLPPE